MNTSQPLSDRVQEVFLDGTWVAYTNYKKILSDVDLKMAMHQVSSLNTIAKLTFHVNYFLGGLVKVLDGGPLDIKDKYSYDLPELKSEEEWENLKNSLFTNAEKFVRQVSELTEEKVTGPFIKEQYGTYLRNIDGLIEHSYYHLGQISIIKKMINEGQS